jgi:hypothetical protein
VAFVALAFGSTAARAAILTNGSFEDGNYDDAAASGHVESLPVGSTAITGWTIICGELGWGRNDNAFAPGTATEGNFLLDLTGFHDAAPYGGVTQTIATTPGTAYALGFDLVTYESDARYRGPISVTATAGNTSQTFTFVPLTGSTGPQSGHFILPFIATGASTVITLQGTSGNQLIGLDNVTVPEPTALGLMAVVGGCLTLRRRARR